MVSNPRPGCTFKGRAGMLKLTVFISCGLCFATQSPLHVHVNAPIALCSAYAQPNVAITVTGQLRRFLEPIVYVTLKENLINAFGGHFKTFIHIKTNVSSPEISMNLHKVSRYLDAQLRIQAAEDVAEKNLQCRYISSDSSPGNLLPDFVLYQYAGLKGAFAMLKRYEEENDMAFDWVLRVRTDTVFLAGVLPFCSYQSDRWYHQSLQWIDHFSMLPRRFAPALYEGVLEDHHACRGNVTAPSWDNLLINAAQKRNIVFQAHDFRTTIAASSHANPKRRCDLSERRYTDATFMPRPEACRSMLWPKEA